MIGKVGFMKNESLINSKVAVIDEKGIVHVMGRVNESKYHIKYLLDYLDNNYFNKNNLTIGSSRDKYGYFFGTLGNIIYFNDGLSGMFYFPNELTKAQLERMKDLDLGIQKVAICFNLKDNGYSNMIGLDGNLSIGEAMEVYIQKDRQRGSLRR